MKWIFLIMSLGFLARAEVQKERFDLHLKNFREQLEIMEKYKHAKDAKGIAKFEAAIRSVRVPAFMVQSLLEAYQEKYPELEGLRELVKIVEDECGEVIDKMEYMKIIESYQASKNDPGFISKTLPYMKARVDEAKSQLVSYFQKARWLTSAESQLQKEEGNTKHAGELVLDLISRKLDKVEWESKKEDRDFLIKYSLKLIKEKLEPEIYDLKDLNGPMGLHKARRAHRKLAILMSATNGLFVLSDELTPEAYQAILNDPIANSKFAKLPEPSEGKRHIFIPRGLFLELNKFIDEMGKSKDTGEAMYEWLPEMLLGSGEAKNFTEAKKMASKIVREWTTYVPTQKTAIKAYTRLLSDRPDTEKGEESVYKALTSILEDQIGMKKKRDCRMLTAAIAE